MTLTRLWTVTVRVDTADATTAVHRAKNASRDAINGPSDLTARTVHQTANYCYVVIVNLHHVDTEEQS